MFSKGVFFGKKSTHEWWTIGGLKFEDGFGKHPITLALKGFWGITKKNNTSNKHGFWWEIPDANILIPCEDPNPRATWSWSKPWRSNLAIQLAVTDFKCHPSCHGRMNPFTLQTLSIVTVRLMETKWMTPLKTKMIIWKIPMFNRKNIFKWWMFQPIMLVPRRVMTP